MKAIGWEEGRNIRFLFVWAEGRNERAPALAGELVAKNVDLIITFGDVFHLLKPRPRSTCHDLRLKAQRQYPHKCLGVMVREMNSSRGNPQRE
jgi:hypothetical protein